MGNTLCGSRGQAVASRDPSKHSTASAHSVKALSLGRISAISAHLRRASGRVLGFRSHAAAANARHQLEERLAEAIQAKAAAGGAKRVSFNRLLLRFPALHEGFKACRAVFRDVAGSEDGELTLDQLRQACTTLGYKMDDESLRRIFTSADVDGSSSLNVHEFLATLAILHILKGPEDQERVDPVILSTWQTAEEAFLCCDSSRQGRLDKEELLAMMHESGTEDLRHSASGRGTDPIGGIAQRRFKELDRDGTGKVSFLEFLFCLESWVEEAEEEQDEEDKAGQQ